MYMPSFYNFFFRKIKIGSILTFVFIGFRLIAKALKSKVRLLAFKKNLSIFKLKLPSGHVVNSKLSQFTILISKKQTNALQKNLNFLKKKASFLYYIQKKPSTRGTAKNCVDHPNGGKGRNGIRLKKSPWGWR